MEIGLGTVQFGLDYGISNDRGRTPFEDVVAILRRARESGVALLDTASAYGSSEEVLGRAMPAAGDGFRVITKTKPLGVSEVTDKDVDAVERAFRQSLRNLKRESVDGLLIHHAGDLLKPGSDRLWDRLRRWRSEGLVRRIGVSVYDPEDARKLAPLAPEIVQLPMSLLDQRFLVSGELARLADAGVEVHVRSLFLQGLLLVDPSSLPGHFAPLLPALGRLRRSLEGEGWDVKQASFGWLEKQRAVAAVILGVTTPAEWSELLAAAEPRRRIAGEWAFPSADWAQNDPNLINPSRWPKREA